MAPFIVLTVTFLGLLAASRGRWRWRWFTSLRIALAAMFLVTASAHFFGGMRADMVRMVPPVFPHPELIVTLTGVAELLGAIGLLIPRTAPLAAGCLSVLLLAMFPANVHAALQGVTLGGEPPTPLLPRTLLQLVFLTATIAAAAPVRFERRVRRASTRFTHHSTSAAPN